MRYLFVLFLFIINPLYLFADYDSQVVRGKITDKVSLLPIEGITVELLNVVPRTATQTDAEGRFRLENVPIGRYKILFSKEGYKEIALGIEITAEKEMMLNLKMEEEAKVEPVINTDPNNPDEPKLRPVPVESGKDRPNNSMSLGGARVLTVEEINRFAGDRQDASRSVSNYAGVNVMDDYNNHLLIRGNSPFLMEWRLENMPIFNPNHLGDFGSTGGQTNILNPNILANSDLSIGAFAPEYGNALSGVFDMQMRSGDDEKFHFSAQYSTAVGAQFLLEGPMAKNNKASFIIGYRYSFFKMLSYAFDLGIRQLDSTHTYATPQTSPRFHDLNFKFVISAGKGGTFTIFGISGFANQKLNGFDASLAEKDQFVHLYENATYRGSSFVGGIKHEVSLGAKKMVYWRNTLGVPFTRVRENVDLQYPGGIATNILSSEGAKMAIVYSSLVNRKVSRKFSIGGGTIAQILFTDVSKRLVEPNGDLDRDSLTAYANLLQGFVHAQYSPSNNFKISGGVYTQWLLFNNSYSVEPRLAVRWYFLPRHSLYLAGGMHSQMLPFDVYAHKEEGEEEEEAEELDLDFMRSVHALLGYQFLASESWRLRIDAFFQHHYNIPISPDLGADRFSLLHYGAPIPISHVDSFFNGGTGRNYGVEISVEKLFDKGFYGLFNAAYTKATAAGYDGLQRNNPFAPLYSMRLLAGKEFKIGRKKINKFFIDLKASHYNFRYTLPVDELESLAANATVYDEYVGYIKKLPAYFRLDIKFAFLFNSQKAKLSHRLAFDFLNVTNQRNVFGYYFDRGSASILPYKGIPLYLDVLYQLRF